jgi:tRNA 2-thiouridine synthesizing protein A
MNRAPEQLRTDLIAYARRRECCTRAWAEAKQFDGPSAGWPPLGKMDESTMPESRHAPSASPDLAPAAVWDAGDMGCGELVMALRGRLNELPPGAVLHVTATDPAAPEDLPAWCRLTENPLIWMRHPEYHIRRKES